MESIQRTFGPMETTVETSSFERALASQASPGFLQPLDHGRSAGGPVGVITGLLTPSAGSPRPVRGGPELPLRAQRKLFVQRRASAPPAQEEPAHEDPRTGLSPEAPLRSLDAVADPVSPPPRLTTTDAVADLPRLHLPTTNVQRAVEDDAPAPPPESSSTGASPTGASPTGSTAGSSPPGSTAGSSLPPVTAFDDTPSDPGDATSVPSHPTPLVARMTAPPTPSEPPRAAPRRLGLGVPLSHSPRLPDVQRKTSDARPLAQPTSAGAELQADGPRPTPTSEEGGPAPFLGLPPVVQREAVVSSPGTPTPTSEVASAAPLLGGQPRVQREAEPAAPGPTSTSTSTSEVSGPALLLGMPPVQREAETAGPHWRSSDGTRGSKCCCSAGRRWPNGTRSPPTWPDGTRTRTRPVLRAGATRRRGQSSSDRPVTPAYPCKGACPPERRQRPPPPARTCPVPPGRPLR